MKQPFAALIGAICLAACVPAQTPPDVGPADAGLLDAAAPDAGDAEVPDAGFVDAQVDAGPPDSGTMDAEVDAGPSLCSADPQAECLLPQDCQDDLPPPSNCEPCRPYNHAICDEGQCVRPTVLPSEDLYTLVITVAPNVLGIESFATFALSDRTAGGRVLTCEDFLQDRVSLDNDCLNILDTRSYGLPQTGDTYAVSFGRFASQQRTLFLIYGHRGAQPQGERLGVSCTSVDVPAPTGMGPYLISGETMVLLP